MIHLTSQYFCHEPIWMVFRENGMQHSILYTAWANYGAKMTPVVSIWQIKRKMLLNGDVPHCNTVITHHNFGRVQQQHVM